ncbi:MAG: lamin tail domain-containing protein [Fibrobacterota bacterium]|nr:lamin tail domain-containing protein [Fibrobacterota bacterium]
MRTGFLLSILVWACLLGTVAARSPSSATAGPILSEAMADPAAVGDAQGEFLELGNPGADTLRLDSLRIDADAQSLVLTPFVLEPGGLFLLCRDSLPSANGGMACNRRWGTLSLANGRGAAIVLSWTGGRRECVLPLPRPGTSWENTWEEAGEFLRFLPSAGAWALGDSATPGSRNSRSARRPESDLGIVDVTWIPLAGSDGEGTLQGRLESRGTGDPPASKLTLALDADWDGEAETPLDSAEVAVSGSGDAVFRFPVGAGVRGIVQARVGRDEEPGNDSFLLPVEPGRPLAITEWLPSPSPGEAEWAEIRNRTADSGGIGRRLDLTRAEFNGAPLGSKAGGLEPGEFLVVTASLERFRARYGAIKARVLQPAGWNALRNAGDTLTLTLAGFTVDSMVYDSKGLSPGREASGSFGAAWEGSLPGTPGYAGEPVREDSWTLSGKVAGPGYPLDVVVRTSLGRAYRLRVFDLEGNRVRDLGGGGPGRRLHVWDGRGEGGAVLKPGPYILCLSRDGSRPRRAAVIVMGEG